MAYDLKGKRIFVAGHRGMVGSAVVRRLATEDCEVITAAREDLDLVDQAAVNAWMQEQRPDAIVMAAVTAAAASGALTQPGPRWAYPRGVCAARAPSPRRPTPL